MNPVVTLKVSIRGFVRSNFDFVKEKSEFSTFPFSHRSSSHVISHLLNFHCYLFRTSRFVVNLVPLKTASLLSARRAESCPVGVVVIRHKKEVYTRRTLKSCVKTEAKKSNFSFFHICTVIDERRQREVKMKILISPDFFLTRRVHMALSRYIWHL